MDSNPTGEGVLRYFFMKSKEAEGSMDFFEGTAGLALAMNKIYDQK